MASQAIAKATALSPVGEAPEWLGRCDALMAEREARDLGEPVASSHLVALPGPDDPDAA